MTPLVIEPGGDRIPAGLELECPRLVWMTPALAGEMLRGRYDDWDYQAAVVEHLVDEIRAGRWDPMRGVGVDDEGFTKEISLMPGSPRPWGTVLDGTHRLSAIAEAGVEVPAFVSITVGSIRHRMFVAQQAWQRASRDLFDAVPKFEGLRRVQ